MFLFQKKVEKKEKKKEKEGKEVVWCYQDKS